MTYLCPRCPIGVNPPSDEGPGTSWPGVPGSSSPDTQGDNAIWKVKSGDSFILNTRLVLPDGVTPANPANSVVQFALADDQFCDPPIWVGTWDDGVYEVDSINNPGLVKIVVPEEVSDCLRRGGYRFDMKVSDRFRRETYTALEGTLLIEYAVGGPQHNVPYRGTLNDAP